MVFNSAMMLNRVKCALVGANATPTVVDCDESIWFDPADGDALIRKIVTTLSDGTKTIQWLDQGDNDVSANSPSFTPSAQDIDNERNVMYITVTDAVSADFGRVHELRETVQYIDGVEQVPTYSWVGVPSVIQPDATLYVADATTQLSSAPIQKQLGDESFDVTGAVGVALPNVPQYATFAQVRIDASTDDAGIRYTTDGTDPADDNSKQQAPGQDIILDGPDSLAGFRALAIGANGEVDAAATASLNVVYENLAADED